MRSVRNDPGGPPPPALPPSPSSSPSSIHLFLAGPADDDTVTGLLVIRRERDGSYSPINEEEETSGLSGDCILVGLFVPLPEESSVDSKVGSVARDDVVGPSSNFAAACTLFVECFPLWDSSLARRSGLILFGLFAYSVFFLMGMACFRMLRRYEG